MSSSSQKVPLVLQMEATECGAASLAMVLGNFDRWVTLEEARARCGTSRDGVNIAAILEAAESYGLLAKAVKREPEQLDQLPLPQILHWNFDHFVVLEKVTANKFHILDPASGRRIIDRQTFGKSFTGLSIALMPGEKFNPGGEKPSVMSALMAQARQSPDAMAIVFGSVLLTVIPGLVISGIMSVFVDEVMGANRHDWLPAILAITLAAAVTSAVLAWLTGWTVASLQTKIATITSTRGFWHAVHLPLTFFAQRSAGEIVSRLRLGTHLGATVAGPLAQLLPNIAIALIYLACIALYQPLIAAIVFALALLNLTMLTSVNRAMAERNRELQLAQGRASGLTTSGLAGIDAYRLLGREDLLIARMAAAEDAVVDVEQKLGLFHALANLGGTAAHLLLSGVVLGLGALEVMDGTLTLGGLVAIQMLAGLISSPVAALASSFSQLQNSAGALLRISDLLAHSLDAAFMADENKQQTHEPSTPGTLATAAPATPCLCLNDVSFGHHTGQPLLQHVNLQLEPGRLIAVLGASGSGKSTLVRLAAGMIQPWAGTITFAGRQLCDWAPEDLRKRLVYVGQSEALFTGSVVDNVSLWDDSISTADASNALEAAGLDEGLKRHTGGIFTRLGNGGDALSGGEMQRLSLARALARKPDLLVLDETTSALDAGSEAAILEMLRACGAAVLIVTHRPGTALRCDEAILMGAGGIIKRGAPSDLILKPDLQSRQEQAVA